MPLSHGGGTGGGVGGGAVGIRLQAAGNRFRVRESISCS